MTMDEVLELLDSVIAGRQLLQIGVVNAAKVVNMYRDSKLREDVLSSDLILADGAAVVWASRILKQPLPERIAGIDLMYELFRKGHEKEYRIFCLGATEEVSAEIERRVHRDYPNVKLVGRHHGYFSSDEEEGIAKKIADAEPDILFVAMTSPKKEHFLARWSGVINVPITHGVGGSFDVMAGKVERAPEIWQKLGLEWLYRVKQEPGRLWKRYFVTNTLFIWMVFKAKLLGK
ncbi:MAG TPA: glycosyltransferase [Gammaproteobacteria bacterium]|nr:glycosyltransferase [Gammaproteobacteria bacterium]